MARTSAPRVANQAFYLFSLLALGAITVSALPQRSHYNCLDYPYLPCSSNSTATDAATAAPTLGPQQCQPLNCDTQYGVLATSVTATLQNCTQAQAQQLIPLVQHNVLATPTSWKADDDGEGSVQVFFEVPLQANEKLLDKAFAGLPGAGPTSCGGS